MTRRRGRSLAGQVLVAVLAVVVVTAGAAAGLLTVRLRQETDDRAIAQARSVALLVAAVPDVAEGLADGDPQHRLAALAERLRAGSGADYIVLIDRAGIRYSHPIPALIGRRIEEPVAALDGRVHTGIDPGSLGPSANAKAPVLGAGGTPVGEVSVGILTSKVADQSSHVVLLGLLYCAIAVAVGVAGALLLVRRLKRVTFGLEPADIVSLVQEREAMLHGIREGVVGLDLKGRVTVLNDEARRLLRAGDARVGEGVEDVLPAGHLRDVVTGEVRGADRVAVTDEHLLLLNRMPVTVAGSPVGWVVTIRDRTELEGLMRQLNDVTSLTTALRAQEHEFSNRLHVLAVLLELGETTEALRYSQELRSTTTLAAEAVRSRIGSPVVAALLVAKTTVAAEVDVRLELDDATSLGDVGEDTNALVTVLGNLIDNAVDSVSGAPDPAGRHPRGVVRVLVVEEPAPEGHQVQVRVRVSDTGPGVPDDRLDRVFVDGYSTKSARGGMRRGVGLALVHRLVTRAGGRITVTNDQGAVFDAVLPLRVKEPVG